MSKSHTVYSQWLVSVIGKQCLVFVCMFVHVLFACPAWHYCEHITRLSAQCLKMMMMMVIKISDGDDGLMCDNSIALIALTKHLTLIST
jgi:hypothetical protein